MAPQKTNFKSYDVQARLLRALVAAHPEIRWDTKKICQCFGSDSTESGLGHKMRHLKTQATIVQRGLEAGYDPKDMKTEDGLFPKDKVHIDKNICKYFGMSTPDGVGWHLREVKSDAKRIKAEADSGGDPLSIPVGGGRGTPAKATPSKSTPGTGRSRVTKSSNTGTRKRGKKRPVDESDKNDSAEDEVDYEQGDMTPTPSNRDKKLKMEQSPSSFGGDAASDMLSHPSFNGTTPTSSAGPSFVAVATEASLMAPPPTTQLAASFSGANNRASTVDLSESDGVATPSNEVAHDTQGSSNDTTKTVLADSIFGGSVAPFHLDTDSLFNIDDYGLGLDDADGVM